MYVCLSVCLSVLPVSVSVCVSFVLYVFHMYRDVCICVLHFIVGMEV